MTKEEIVDSLEMYTIGRPLKSQVSITVKELQGFIDAIKALEREPCEDAVNRLDALAIISTIKSNHIEHNVPINYGTILDIDIALQKLPPATPIRKEGKPICDIDSQDWSFNKPLKCPFCDERFGFDNNYNYCPNCGAKMKESEEINAI